MNAETFLEQFETLAEAPSGVEQLRAMILQLAVQGKLVPQDPKDEPASSIVHLASTSRSKSEKPDCANHSSKEPKLPAGWIRIPLTRIAEHRLGKMLDKGKNRGDLLPYLRNTNVQWWRFELGDLKEMRFQEDERADFEVRAGDLLICEGGEPGRCAVWTDTTQSLMIQKAIHRVRPLGGINPFYLAICLRNDALSGRLDRQFTGATIKHFTGQELARYPVPLPPLAEQKRIVAKVDQLLALCDELAARQEARRVARTQLVGATLDRLVSTRSAADLPSHVNRLRTHFDHLFDTPTTIPKLRQTILQLAVQGQLVPQAPNDEPTDNVVERLVKARAQFEATARLRGELTQIEPEEQPFSPPSNWRWIRFGELANIVGGVTLGRKLEGRTRGLFPYLRVANVQQGRLSLDIIKEVEIPVDELPKYRLEPGDVLLTEGGDWDKLGRSAIWRGEIDNCLHQNHIFRARPFTVDVQSDWLTLFTNSPVGRTYFQNAAKKTTNLASINMTQLRNCPIPVPPLAEQKRIVAKVTELLSLCDTLEAQLQTAESASSQLLSAAVHHLLTL